MDINILPINEASELAKSLDLKNVNSIHRKITVKDNSGNIKFKSLAARLAYTRLSKNDKLPNGLPKRPDRHYKKEEWGKIGKWIGFLGLEGTPRDFEIKGAKKFSERDISFEEIKKRFKENNIRLEKEGKEKIRCGLDWQNRKKEVMPFKEDGTPLLPSDPTWFFRMRGKEVYWEDLLGEDYYLGLSNYKDIIEWKKVNYLNLLEAIKWLKPFHYSHNKYSQWTVKEDFPDFLPPRPYIHYKEEWVSLYKEGKLKNPKFNYTEFFSTNNITTSIKYKEEREQILSFIDDIEENIETYDYFKLRLLLQELPSEYQGAVNKLIDNSKFKAVFKNPHDKENTLKTLREEFKTSQSKNRKKNTGNKSGGRNNGELSLKDLVELEIKNVEEQEPKSIQEKFDEIDSYDRFLQKKGQAWPLQLQEFFIIEGVNKMFNEYFNHIEFKKNEKFELPKAINVITKEITKQFEKELLEISNWDWKSEINNSEYLKRDYEPNLMQLLFAKRLLKKKRYLNFSGVGAGKTLAAILSAQLTNSPKTLIVCVNATKDKYITEIKNSFSNVSVYEWKDEGFFEDLSESKHNYIIVNYEFFQQADDRVDKLISAHKFGTIILDEAQKGKKSNETMSEISLRHKRIKKLIEANEDENLYLTAMSATPFINNLVEVKELLKLITGNSYENFDTVSSTLNAEKFYKEVVIHGLRLKIRYKQEVQFCYPQQFDYINTLEQIACSKDFIDIEKILLNKKLQILKDEGHFKKGLVIYSEFLGKGIKDKVRLFCCENNLIFGEYSGDNKEGLQGFYENKVDILFCTKAVGTGLDGLQKHTNKLALLNLPWSHSDFEQLIGRVVRQGSNYLDAKVIIPMVMFDLNGKEWSWDKYKWALIKYKKDIGDCVLDGVVSNQTKFAPKTFILQFKEILKKFKENLKIAA